MVLGGIGSDTKTFGFNRKKDQVAICRLEKIRKRNFVVEECQNFSFGYIAFERPSRY